MRVNPRKILRPGCIDEHRGRFGVEPVCRVLRVPASAYHRRATDERSVRQVEDERLLERTPGVAPGQLLRLQSPAPVESAAARGRDVGRGRVERLIRTHGLLSRSSWTPTRAGPIRAASTPTRPAPMRSRTRVLRRQLQDRTDRRPRLAHPLPAGTRDRRRALTRGASCGRPFGVSERGAYMITITPRQTYERAGEVVAVGSEAVEGHAPQQRADDEHATVRGEHAPEVGVGLQSGDGAVAGQCDGAREREEHAAVVFDRLPHQVGAADLGHGRRDEQCDRAQRHALAPATCVTARAWVRPAEGSSGSSNSAQSSMR